ncbi:MAG TPA: hypothetical protein VIU64_09640 [Polyangia bacterium]
MALACWVAVALAEPGAGTASGRLSVRIAAPPAVVAEFSDRLGSRLAARGVNLEVTSVPDVDFARLVATPPDTDREAPLARVWLDGRGPERALLFLKPRQGDRVLVRKIELRRGFDQVALAQIAYIIERAVASLLVSEPIGVPQSEARAAVEAVLPAPAPTAKALPVEPPPAVKTPPAADASPAGEAPAAVEVPAAVAAAATLKVPVAIEGQAGSLYRLGVFGGAGTWSSDAAAVARIGVEGTLERTGGARRLGLSASVVADPGFHVDLSDGDLLVRSLALHVFATVSWRGGSYGGGGIAVGPALLVSHVEPMLKSSQAGPLVSVAALTNFDPGLGVTARWELPLGRWTSLFLAALLDVVPLHVQYAVAVSGSDKVLFAPWILRPGLVLGVATGSALR